MSNGIINTFHQDNFLVNFSNFPEVHMDGKIQKVDLRVFDYFVKNVVIPDMTLGTIDVEWMNGIRIQPISRINDSPTDLTIEFKAEENLTNYLMFYAYIKQMRHGISPSIPFYKNVIKTIYVDMMDNESRKIGRLEFKNAIPTSLGSLTLTVGDSSELSFPVSFLYETFSLARYSECSGTKTFEDKTL